MSGQYARMAREYYQEYRPEAMTDLDAGFFDRIGQEIEARVQEEALRLMEVEPVETEYLKRVGQLTNQRARAREIALAEFLPTSETAEISETTSS